MDLEHVTPLIAKIEKGLPEVQQRSIASLYSKLTVGILDPTTLPQLKGLPGVLLTWINDNQKRSEPLLKCLNILQYYTQSPEGLSLLEVYEASDFFRELKEYLLSQQPNHDVSIPIVRDT